MDNIYQSFIDFTVELRRLRMKSILTYPASTQYPPDTLDKLNREVQALYDTAIQHGIKGGAIKKLRNPVRFKDGWTNFILTIQERTIRRPRRRANADDDFAPPELGPWEFSFLFEEGFAGLPQTPFQRIALRYGIADILRFDYPCSRCFGRGHWVSSNRGRTLYGVGVNLFGDSSKPCFRCLGYKVDPEFWDTMQAQYGEFYDDPVWVLPSAANNEYFEHFSSARVSAKQDNYGE